jgi:hypothetical protein
MDEIIDEARRSLIFGSAMNWAAKIEERIYECGNDLETGHV